MPSRAKTRFRWFSLSALFALFGSGAGAAEFTWSDHFSGRGTAAAPVPGWSGDVFVWTLQAGKVEGSWLKRAFLYPPQRTLYGKITAEVAITPRKAVAKGWKIGALAMVQDEDNFWHLALVEKPNDTGAGHYVELCEMRQGHWLAQANLQCTENRGGDFSWQYGRTYRLRIALDPKGITGTVSSPSGKELTRIAFAFTGPAVTRARPALEVNAMAARFDDFRFRADPRSGRPIPSPEERRFPAYAVRGSGIPAPGAGPGFFRAMQLGDRWWIVDPRGELFYAVGTDHVNYYAHWCQKLGYAPYHRNCEKKYGSVDRWAASASARLRAWGFNLLGAGNIAPVRYRGLAHTLFAAFGTGFAAYSALVEQVHWTGFPNVFDPRWPIYCEAQARKVCAPNRNDPWLFGYFLDNELEWWGKEHSPVGIFIDAMKCPPVHSGKQALVAFLKEQHHQSLADFNRVWHCRARTWKQVAAMRKLDAPGPAAEAIQKRFVALAARRYFRVAVEAIRKYDPNHLILGCRFAGNAPDSAWKACAETCDVVTFNYYPRIDFQSGDLSDIAAVFEKYEGLTHRPMMVTEWSFPALDAGLPCTHGAGMRVDTQAQKARCFTVMQHLLFRLPFMVGSDYFMWADEPAQGISDTFPEDSNYGLVNVEDVPYSALTAACRRLNPLAVILHEGKLPETYLKRVVQQNGKVRVEVENLARVRAAPTVQVRVDGVESEAVAARVPAGDRAVIVVPGRLAPGEHAVQVHLERDPRIPPGCRGKVDLVAGLYRPGLPWPGNSARVRRPLFVPDSPPGIRVSWPLFLDAPLGEPPPAAAWFSPTFPGRTGSREPLLPVAPSGGQAVALVCPPSRPGTGPGGLAGLLYGGAAFPARRALASRESKTPVQVERFGKTGFRLDNGILTLRNDGKAGNVVDRISLRGIPLGAYNPLVWQDPGQNQWVRASRVESVSVRHLPGGAVMVDVLAGGGEPAGAITAVNPRGKSAQRRVSPVSFRVAHRLILWPGQPWFACRVLWVENRAVHRDPAVKGLVFSLLSAIGGESAGDVAAGAPHHPGVPNYYRTGKSGAWHDPTVGAWLGAIPLTATSRIEVHFWKDPAGGEHPDAALPLRPPVVLEPGKRREISGNEWLLVFGARDHAGNAPEAWSRWAGALDALSKIQVHLGPLERH